LVKATKEMQARAEAAFAKKEQQAREGSQAAAEYAGVGRALRDRTVRLRALRLDKEVADRKAEADREPPTPKKKRRPKESTPPVR